MAGRLLGMSLSGGCRLDHLQPFEARQGLESRGLGGGLAEGLVGADHVVVDPEPIREVRWSVQGCTGIPIQLGTLTQPKEINLRVPTLKVDESFNRDPTNPGRVRLKRTLNRRVGDREYFKWLIADVPPDTVEQLGWQEGEELEGVPYKGGLLLRIPDQKREKTGIGGRRR